MKKYVFLGTFLIALDAITKIFSEKLLTQEFIIVENFLSLYFIKNPGIAFSLPLTGTLLKIVTVILISGIFLYYWKHEKPRKSAIIDTAFTLIFAGAIGNAWERIGRGFVSDFIAIEHFSVFNLADSYITIGAAILIYYYMTHTS